MNFIKKITQSDLFKYMVILFPVFVGMLIYNFLTPLYADDYSYMYSFSTGERITNIWDIFPSMYSHYFSMNGRLVLHFIAQLLLMWGDNVANVINSAAFILLGLLIYFHVYLSFRKVKYFPLIFTYFSLFMFTPDFGQSFLWITGASNYLYGPLIFLVFLLPYRINIDETKIEPLLKETLKSIILFVLGLLVGNTNENTAVTAVFISVVYLIYRVVQYRGVQLWSVFGLMGATISTCFNLLSPGTHNRLGDNKINIFPIKNLILYVFNLLEIFAPILLVLIVFLIIYTVVSCKSSKSQKRKENIIKFLLESKIEIFYILVFLASYFSLIVVSTPLRVLSGPLVYLIIFILCVYKKCMEHISDVNKENIKKINVFAVVGISIIFIGSYMNNFLPMKIVHTQFQNRLSLIYEAKEKGEKTVNLPTIYCINKYSCYKYEGDLSSDPSSWENKGIAHYFGLDEVIMDNKNLIDYY